MGRRIHAQTRKGQMKNNGKHSKNKKGILGVGS